MEDDTKKVFKMGDDLIAVIRELVQLSFLTGTNIVDHLRAVVIEKDEETGKLVPTEEYIQAYDEMIVDLNEQARKAQETYIKEQLVGEEQVPTSEDELN